jgi:hypothetical protein
MKTKTQNQKSELKSRPEQLNTKPLPKIDLALRRANRALNTEKLLALLCSETPRFFAVAEVVGKWVWIQFNAIPAAEIRQQLAQLGFHWNNSRQSWQHPCDTIADERADYDPRRRYGSYFAADRIAV